MAVTSTLAVTAIQSRDEARDQRKQAEGLVGFMLGDLKEKLEPIGRLDALDAVGSRALAYYQAQDKSQLSDEALAQRSKALTLMGEIAQARGDTAGALNRYQEALASTAEIVRRYPDDPQKLFDHAQNVFWVGYIAYQRADLREATSHFRDYKSLAEKMVELAPDKSEYRLEEVYANNNLGTVLMDERRYREASTVFSASVDVSQSLAAGAPSNTDYQKQLVNSLSWLADAHEYSGALEQALAEHERQLRVLADLKRAAPRDTEVDRYAMTAHRTAGRLLASRGDAAGAFRELRTSVDISDNLFRIEPDNTEWLQANAAGRYDLAKLQLATGDSTGAATTARAGCDIANRLLERDKSVADWKAQLRVKCLNLRARIAIASGAADEAFELARQSVAAAQSTPRPVEQRLLTFDSRAVGGNALSAMGKNAEAASWWRAAVAIVPRSVQLRPVEMEQLAAVERRLGNASGAARLNSALSAMGYRYPNFGKIM
jgi:tetratricopeptide (TPR) repeat protein